MPEHLHVHVPFRILGETLPFLLEKKLQPEIAFKGAELEKLDHEEISQAARKLSDAGLAITVHAPFMDLNPGALDPLVQEVTLRRFHQTLDAAQAFSARLVVFHPSYDRWRYAGQSRLWIEQNLSFWPSLLKKAEQTGILLALENVFEEEPEPLASLLNEIDSPWLGHCFDVGHWHLFCEGTMEEWFNVLGPRLIHLHLHDNSGKADDHLPIGEGKIDFSTLFKLVSALPDSPLLTLEARNREDCLLSLARTRSFLSR